MTQRWKGMANGMLWALSGADDLVGAKVVTAPPNVESVSKAEGSLLRQV